MPKQKIQLGSVSKSIRRRIIAFVLLVILLGSVLAAVPKFRQALDAISDMNLLWVAVAIILEILSCVGYIVVFLRIFSRLPTRFGTRVALSELAFGGAVSLGGAGSLLIGGWLLVNKGASVKKVTKLSTVLFLLTSAINVFTLILAAIGLLTHLLPGTRHLALSIVPLSIGSGIVAVGLALPVISNRLSKARRKGKIVTSFQYISEPIKDTEKLLLRPGWHMVGATAYLWFDIGVLIACFAALGHVPPLADIVLAYQLGLVANILPIPGNIGTLDAGIVGMMLLYGIKFKEAIAATVVFHAIMLFIPLIAGLVSYFILLRTQHEPLKLKPLSNS